MADGFLKEKSSVVCRQSLAASFVVGKADGCLLPLASSGAPCKRHSGRPRDACDD